MYSFIENEKERPVVLFYGLVKIQVLTFPLIFFVIYDTSQTLIPYLN